MKTVAVYGGSFNPPHRGHFETLRIVRDEVSPDTMMMLFSKNPFKPAAVYAALEHRIAMSQIMSGEFPDLKIVFSDYEEKTGATCTYDVLSSLHDDFPETSFIWVMGADNLAEFHTWENSDLIINGFPIFVVNRRGFREEALSSQTAVKYAELRTEASFLKAAKKGWALSKGIPSDKSSHEIRNSLADGRREFASETDTIIPYITQHRLYGI